MPHITFQAIDSFRRCQPKPALLILAQTAHHVAGQSRVRAEGGKLATLIPAQSVQRGKPHRAVAARKRRTQTAIVRQAFGFSKVNKLPVLQLNQAAATRRDPETSVCALLQTEDVGVDHLRHVALVESGEANAIEARQPKLSASPEVAVPGLEDGLNAIVGQPIIHAPEPRTKLRT